MGVVGDAGFQAMCTPLNPEPIRIATYHAEPVGCGDWPGSVLMVNTSLTTPSGAKGCASWKESKSDPGGAGVFTMPIAALVSQQGSVNSVSPGMRQGVSVGPLEVIGNSPQLVPSPMPFVAVTLYRNVMPVFVAVASSKVVLQAGQPSDTVASKAKAAAPSFR